MKRAHERASLRTLALAKQDSKQDSGSKRLDSNTEATAPSTATTGYVWWLPQPHRDTDRHGVTLPSRDPHTQSRNVERLFSQGLFCTSASIPMPIPVSCPGLTRITSPPSAVHHPATSGNNNSNNGGDTHTHIRTRRSGSAFREMT